MYMCQWLLVLSHPTSMHYTPFAGCSAIVKHSARPSFIHPAAEINSPLTVILLCISMLHCVSLWIGIFILFILKILKIHFLDLHSYIHPDGMEQHSNAGSSTTWFGFLYGVLKVTVDNRKQKWVEKGGCVYKPWEKHFSTLLRCSTENQKYDVFELWLRYYWQVVVVVAMCVQFETFHCVL